MFEAQVRKLKHTLLTHVAVLVEVDIDLHLSEVGAHGVAARSVRQRDLQFGAEQAALPRIHRNQLLRVLHVLLRGLQQRLKVAGQFDCVGGFFLAFVL